MISHILSACPSGVEAVPITVEVDVRGSQRLKVSIVGLPDAATKESKDRLIPAITNSGFSLDDGEIVINLSPADLRKEGMAYDLPMAVGILCAMGIVPENRIEASFFLGELALDGSVRSVRSILAAAECARESGAQVLFVPRGNGPEAALVEGIEIYEVDHLSQLIHYLRGKRPMKPVNRQELQAEQPRPGSSYDLNEVKGHVLVKRVLEIAAAGHHNILLFGPPGSGKSMLSKRLPGIMPPMSTEEIIEVTRIYSCAGKLGQNGAAIRVRPFRAPHHTASPIAMIGGGSTPRPGEVTQAHRGVLFLDEFPEFPRIVLEVLRQPLEDRIVTISRASQQVTFPADFLLIAAMNPCPCGWLGDLRRRCDCNEGRIQQYRSRISGPLLDRIDLHIEVPVISMSSIRQLPPSEPSRVVQERVIKARQLQQERFESSLICNGNMSPKQIQSWCRLPDPLAELLERQIESRGCSTRVHDKVLRVARTIADLAGRQEIVADDLLEALGYRQMDSKPKTGSRQAPEERYV